MGESGDEGLIFVDPTDIPMPLPLELPTLPQQHQRPLYSPPSSSLSRRDEPIHTAESQTQYEVVIDDATASKLFPKSVNTTRINLERLVRTELDTIVQSLRDEQLIAEIASGNDTVSMCAVRVSNFATMLDEFWALYAQEYRAFCLWSSRGLANPATAAGTRVSGAAALGFMIPTDGSARSAINKPNELPAPPPPKPLTRGAPARGPEASIDRVMDWHEDHEGDVHAVPAPGEEEQQQQQGDRRTGTVDTFDTRYESLTKAAMHLLEANLRACRAPDVVGTRGVGHRLAMALYTLSQRLVAVLKRIGETRCNQRRMWVAYVAPNTHRNDKAQRTSENGFVRLPPL